MFSDIGKTIAEQSFKKQENNSELYKFSSLMAEWIAEPKHREVNQTELSGLSIGEIKLKVQEAKAARNQKTEYWREKSFL